MHQSTFFEPYAMARPEKARETLAAKVAKLRTQIEARAMPTAQDEPVEDLRPVRVSLMDWPEFKALKGIQEFEVRFPETGPLAGEMVIVRLK